ncbi:MAG: acyl carrier protein [Bacteroidota bacterium]|jgi:acyl carrier protein
MSREIILQQVIEIFRDVLDNDKIELSESTIAKDVEEWDSLNHIQLVVAVEKKFSIRFTALEIQSWTNVGGMIDSIVSKSNPKS